MNRQLAELREFMDVRRIPKELRVKVRHYMELLCTTTSRSRHVCATTLSELSSTQCRRLLCLTRARFRLAVPPASGPLSDLDVA